MFPHKKLRWWNLDKSLDPKNQARGCQHPSTYRLPPLHQTRVVPQPVLYVILQSLTRLLGNSNILALISLARYFLQLSFEINYFRVRSNPCVSLDLRKWNLSDKKIILKKLKTTVFEKIPKVFLWFLFASRFCFFFLREKTFLQFENPDFLVRKNSGSRWPTFPMAHIPRFTLGEKSCVPLREHMVTVCVFLLLCEPAMHQRCQIYDSRLVGWDKATLD